MLSVSEIIKKKKFMRVISAYLFKVCNGADHGILFRKWSSKATEKWEARDYVEITFLNVALGELNKMNLDVNEWMNCKFIDVVSNSEIERSDCFTDFKDSTVKPVELCFEEVLNGRNSRLTLVKVLLTGYGIIAEDKLKLDTKKEKK